MAFPTTSVLDTFVRADENPLSGGGQWTNKIKTTNDNLRIVSNQAQAQASFAGDQCSAWWNVSTFGADCEAYITIALVQSSSNSRTAVHARLATPGTAGVDGYSVVQRRTGVATQGIYRLDNGVETLLGAAVTPTWASGDKLGIEIIGTTIRMMQYTGGAWVELASRTDSTYSAAGNIGFDVGTSSVRMIDFGGGAVAAAPSNADKFFLFF